MALALQPREYNHRPGKMHLRFCRFTNKAETENPRLDSSLSRRDHVHVQLDIEIVVHLAFVERKTHLLDEVLVVGIDKETRKSTTWARRRRPRSQTAAKVSNGFFILVFVGFIYDDADRPPLAIVHHRFREARVIP